jgi:hypothetical protein
MCALYYQNWIPVPEGLPTKRGSPLYPDYGIYPENIIAGFQQWPLLYPVKGNWTFKNVHPVKDCSRFTPALRKGDPVDRVLELLGAPPERNFDSTAQLHVMKYSQDVLLVLDSEENLEIVCLQEDPESRYRNWDYVFVRDSENHESMCENVPRAEISL